MSNFNIDCFISGYIVSRRRLLAAGAIIAIVGLFAGRTILSRRPSGPMEVSMWYWHTPFSTSPSDKKFQRLFVRAGTISATGDGVEMILPQAWTPSQGAPPVHLVLVMDGGVVRHFEDLSNQRTAACIASSFLRQRAAAEHAGLKVQGLQIDFDCATRLLPKYSDLLQRVHRSLPRGTTLSITSLPTWFTSRDLRELISNVDFYCPQFYETSVGKTLHDARPVSDLRVLRNGLEAAGRLGKPFYAGIPAYGHAFMFDDRGRLLGTYRGMSATDAARHPSFHIVRSWPANADGKPAAGAQDWIGEEFLGFAAVRPGAGGKGLGYHLLYTLPTARMLALNLREVREHRPDNCLGAIVFRSPEPDEIMTLPSPSIAAVLQGRAPRPAIRSSVKAARVPWNLIEGTGSDASSDVTVSLTNTGNAGSSVSPGSVTLILRFDAPGIEAEAGDFDRIEMHADSGLRASAARATTIVCTRSFLKVGEVATIGPIRVTGAARSVQGEWSVITPGGFETVKGKVNTVSLQDGVGSK